MKAQQFTALFHYPTRLFCAVKLWTGGRFSESEVSSSDIAIDQFKQRFSARDLILVGYSGEGSRFYLTSAVGISVRLCSVS